MDFNEIFEEGSEEEDLLQRYLDRPYNVNEKDFKKYGLTVKEIDREFTGEEDHMNCLKVLKITKCGVNYFFRFEGFEGSYECAYELDSATQVFPKQVMTTIYVENENEKL